MGRFSIWELLIVLLIVALLFGTKKLRNIGGDLGGAIKSFRGAMKENETDNKDDTPRDGSVIEGESKSGKDSKPS